MDDPNWTPSDEEESLDLPINLTQASVLTILIQHGINYLELVDKEQKAELVKLVSNSLNDPTSEKRKQLAEDIEITKFIITTGNELQQEVKEIILELTVEDKPKIIIPNVIKARS